MKTLSSDTHRKAEKFQIGLIRKATIFRRLQMVVSLSKTTRQLSWQGICERYPEKTLDVRIQLFVSLLYEDAYLARRIVDLVKEKGIR